MRNFIRLAAALLVGVSLAGLAGAQARFPSGPVRIVVPFPPGGTTDILARDVATELQQKWGVPVTIDNKAGASGTIGSEQVMRSPADGQTLLLTATHHVINPSLFQTLKYDTRKDFTPIALIAGVPNVLVVHPSTPANSVQELIALAKAKPGSLSFGSAGQGWGQPPGRRTVQAQRRHRHRARAVQGCGAGTQRFAGWTDSDDV